MTLINYQRNIDDGVIPLVMFIDLQVGYGMDGVRDDLGNIEECLFNCRALLSECRKLGMPIVHFRLQRSNAYLNAALRHSQWITEFRPKPSEMIFEHCLPSCYSNREFCAFVETIEAPTLILAGLTGERACLSTAVDAFHRGHIAIFVADASASRSLVGVTSADSHTAIAKVVSLYAEVTSTQDVLCRISRIRVN